MVWVAPVGQELKFDEQFCVLAVQFRFGFGLFRRAVLGDGEPQSGTGDRKCRNLEDARPWNLKFAQESLGPFKSGCRFFFVNYNF